MRRHIAYLKYVLRHKWYVFLACFMFRVPLWIAITHDWDKFLPDEWLAYARTFYKPNGEKQYKESGEFAYARMLHQHRNKHHWQYWLWVNIPTDNCAIPLHESNCLVWDRGNAQQVVKFNREYIVNEPPLEQLVCCPDPMPDVYRREMLADWMGVGKALGKPFVWEWYEKNRENMQLHPETRAWVEEQLTELKRKAEQEWRHMGMGLISSSWWWG